MSEPMCKEDLDALVAKGCPCCEHEGKKSDLTGKPAFLHARCHIDSPLAVTYLKGDLCLWCATCKELVFKIAVADVESYKLRKKE